MFRNIIGKCLDYVDIFWLVNIMEVIYLVSVKGI